MNKLALIIKRFFWFISGSEISILEKCPTDHNRHMNIGLAIFATTLIAFLTGSLAGFEFGSRNIYSALMFGTIWSLLVFTIDRNMVGTLQKTPNEKKGKLIGAVLYRTFLSLLIAFFIAIPLELWIFKEEIAKQMKVDNDSEIINQRNIEENIYNIAGLESVSQKYSDEQSKLDSLLNREEPPSGYKNYSTNKANLEHALEVYNNRLKTYNKRVNIRKEYYSKAPEYYDTIQNRYLKILNTEFYNKWYALWIRTNSTGSETIELDDAKQKYLDLQDRVDQIQNDYFTDISTEKQRNDSLYIKTSQELAMSSDSVNIKTTEHEKFVYSQQGFIKQWIALNNVSEFWVVFFIWFIRLVFFVIEMLPTLTKVLTPLGAYDIKLFYKIKEVGSNSEYEMDVLTEMQKIKLELSIKGQTEIEKHKLDQELKLQGDILDNLSEKQSNIAKSIIDEWEKQQKENASKDLSVFLSNKS